MYSAYSTTETYSKRIVYSATYSTYSSTEPYSTTETYSKRIVYSENTGKIVSSNRYIKSTLKYPRYHSLAHNCNDLSGLLNN